MINNKHFLLALKTACLFCAAWGLAYQLAFLGTPLNWDEAFTAIATDPSLSFAFIIKNFLITDTHPPLYYFICWVFNHFIPAAGEVTLHIPSLCFNVLTLLGAFFFFPKHLPKVVKYIFILLLTSNGSFIYYGTEARAYSMLLFFSTALLFVTCNIINKKDIKRTDYVLFFIFTLLLTYTHYFGSLVAGLNAIFVMVFFYKSKNQAYKNFALIYIITFLLFLPWLMPNLYYNAVQQRMAGNWWVNIIHTHKFFIDLMFLFFSNIKAQVIFLLLALSAVFTLRKGMKYKTEISLCLCLFFPVIILALLIKPFISLLMARYFICLLPSAFMFFAIIFYSAFEKNKYLVILLALFVLCAFPSVKIKKFNGVRDASLIIMQLPQKQIKVLAMDSYPAKSIPYLYTYYINKILGADKEVIPAQSVEQGETIWMPTCTDTRIILAEEKLGHRLTKIQTLRESCLLTR